MFSLYHRKSRGILLFVVIVTLGLIACDATKEVSFVIHENLKINLKPDFEKNDSSSLECQMLHLQAEEQNKRLYFTLNTIRMEDDLFACQMFSVKLNPKRHGNGTFQNDNANVYITDRLGSQASCQVWKDLGYDADGMYPILINRKSVSVYCDMTTFQGGWIVFQRRFDRSVNFSRNWQEYKNGFGQMVGGEFWLGSEYLHHFLFGWRI